MAEQLPGPGPDADGWDERAEAPASHPVTGMNDTVHQRHRLGILTITSGAPQAGFGYLRDALQLTSGNLSAHLGVLEDAGLIRIEKRYVGRRPRTWVSITRQGRDALAAEMAALGALAREHAGQPATEPDTDTDTDTGTGTAGGHHERDK